MSSIDVDGSMDVYMNTPQEFSRKEYKNRKENSTKVAITYLRFVYCLVTNVKSIDYYCDCIFSAKNHKIVYVHSGIFRTHVKIANVFILLFYYFICVFCSLLDILLFIGDVFDVTIQEWMVFHAKKNKYFWGRDRERVKTRNAAEDAHTHIL